jgi:hypothetical protein
MNYCLIKDANHNDPFTLKLIRECKLALTKNNFSYQEDTLGFQEIVQGYAQDGFHYGLIGVLLETETCTKNQTVIRIIDEETNKRIVLKLHNVVYNGEKDNWNDISWKIKSSNSTVSSNIIEPTIIIEDYNHIRKMKNKDNFLSMWNEAINKVRNVDNNQNLTEIFIRDTLIKCGYDLNRLIAEITNVNQLVGIIYKSIEINNRIYLAINQILEDNPNINESDVIDTITDNICKPFKLFYDDNLSIEDIIDRIKPVTTI